MQVRYNGQNLPQSDAVMFGSYARRSISGWIGSSTISDAEGNLYEVRNTLDLNGAAICAMKGSDLKQL